VKFLEAKVRAIVTMLHFHLALLEASKLIL